MAVPAGWGQQLILRFDSSGKQLGPIGQLGDGPGEYRSVTGLYYDRGDSLYVVRDAYRIEVFDPGGRPVRSIKTPISGISAIVALGDGRFLAVGRGMSASSAGLPIHLVDTSGSIARSFGLPNFRPQYRFVERRLAVDAQGNTWSVDVRNYRVDQTDSVGRHLLSIGVRTSRFSPPIMPGGDTLFKRPARTGTPINVTDQVMAAKKRRDPRRIFPPAAEVAGVSTEGDSLLWTLLRVPVTNWRDIPRTYLPGYPEEPVESDVTKPLLYDAILDVIRLRTNELVTRTVLAGYWEMPRAGRLIRLAADSTGVFTGDVFDARVVRK